MDQRELRRLQYEISGVRVLLEMMRIGYLCRRYNPLQPRSPAGRPDGGQWVPWDRGTGTAGLYNESNRTRCEAQYESDMFQCDFGLSGRSRAACREQAQIRYVNCMKDLPIPDLIYLLGVVR